MKNKERDHYVPLLKKVKRIMKITTLFILCAIFSISATTYAQNYKVTINKQNSTIIEVLKEIEKNSEFTFFFNDNRVNVNQPVSVMAKNATIQDVLDKVFRNTGYVYQIIDRQVLIKASASGKSGEHGAVVQQSNKRTITGTVKDPNGDPIIGANIVQKGTTNGTITDADGNFTITLPIGSATLGVSYIGYKGTEVVVGNKNTIAVILKEDTEMLDEVVVVGYGTMKKKDLTGAVAAVKGDDLAARHTTQLSTALQGATSGVMV
ncbi:MAG: carboxypeptidase-like regulatory domain-containing protein, partial [Parabacteroides sp.]|nr:carboxypeptidase-like regulatory domain-containing protein [Parabacteroides sp.]